MSVFETCPECGLPCLPDDYEGVCRCDACGHQWEVDS